MKKISHEKFTIPHSKIWLRPDQAYFQYQEQAKNIDPNEMEFNGKYKRVRELRDIAVFGLAFYSMQEHNCFVQMNDFDDSPDAFLMRPISKVTNEIAPIEITFYGRNKLGMPEKPLEEKLTEPRGKFQKLPQNYWLLIHLGKHQNVNHQAIADKLSTINNEFNIFSIQEVATHPDTIARVVSYKPKLEGYEINIGAICHRLSNSNIPGILTVERGKPPK